MNSAYRLEKRLTSFWRKRTDRDAPNKEWTLHRKYEAVEDAMKAYETLIAKTSGRYNYRVVHNGDIVRIRNKA